MRMYRILTAVVAFALVGLTPLAIPSAASAVVAAAADRGDPAGAARALPHRKMHDKVVQPRRYRLIFKGRVDPGHGPVFVERKNCRRCRWHRVDKVRTDGTSRWQVRIYAPRRGEWFYRGYVPAYGGYARSRTGIWRTYTV
ncbi:MAG: hypothetical protein JWO11_944 [Nocardioides sp.]|nr:hypothetical protein [Nocardioides sp.]